MLRRLLLPHLNCSQRFAQMRDFGFAVLHVIHLLSCVISQLRETHFNEAADQVR